MKVYALHLGDHDYRYIGITVGSLEGRLKGHRKNARLGSQWPVSNWIRKHYDLIEIVLLEEHSTIEDLKAAEIRLIAQYKPLGRLLNATIGGDGRVGVPHSLETRVKMSKAQRGKKRSDETRANISAARKGFKMSDEQKEKLRQARTGQTTPDDVRKKISASQKGRVISPEHRAKLRQASIGHIVSAETRQKISDSCKGAVVPAERRAKISEGLKKAYREGRRS